jgi:hypothetical protein
VSTATENPRSRVALLERQERSLAEREVALVALIEASPQAEAEARREHLRRSPLTLPGATSPAVRERRRREHAEAELANVRANATTVGELLAEARRENRAEELRRLNREAEQRREAERAAWRVLGERFAGLVDAFGDYKATVEAFGAWREPAAAALGIGGDELERMRGDELRFAVVPVCADFGAMLEVLTAVSLDPGLNGYRENAGRSLDDYGELVGLTPNLIGKAEDVAVLRVAKRGASSRHPLGGSWGR